MSDRDETVRDAGAAERRPSEAEAESFSPGTRVGRYVLGDVLGAGGMGVVYTAFDPELDRKVAIKLLQALPGVAESGGQTWLLREAQAMARLAHPNVVAVYDVGAMGGDRVFVAMELVEGETLRAWLRESRTWRDIVVAMRAAGAGLAAAHAVGLVHRDFKPDNVLVGIDGRVRVMDFGLARLGADQSDARRTSDLQIEAKSPLSERLTITGALVGTPAYMAPEIYRGQSTDARADQFAFGVALYEALYRTRPFDRKDLVEGRAVAPKPPATAKVPAWLERVVMRAIAIDPAARFASMDALLAALASDPTVKRRQLAIGAAAAVACGGIVAGVLVMRSPAVEAPCSGANARLAGVWDAKARASLETAFKKIGRPFVDDAIRGTEKTLDAYATSWTGMHAEACTATRIDGHQTADVMTLRMNCLDDRLVELKTLAGLFAAGDEQLVIGAVTAAQKLSAIGDCADVAALMAPDPLPKDPAARAAVTAMQKKLAEARAIYKAARPKDTLAITRGAADAVDKLGHLPTEAALHLLLGQSLWVLEGPEKGEPELMKAAFAAEAGKADDVKVEAWLQLTNLATEGERFDVARERWQQASAALARLGTKWDLKVRVTAAGALIDSRQGKFDSALATAKDAREIAEKHTESPSYAYALLVEATILNASTHAQEALDNFQKVLAYHEALGKNRIDVGVTLVTMASAELSLGKTADAIAHAKRALEIDESIYGAESKQAARTLATISAAQGMAGDGAAALATAERALAIFKKTVGENDEQYASVLGQIADTLVGLGRHAEAIPYLDRALVVLTAKLGPGHVQTLTVVLTKCDALRAAGKLSDAIATCERALAAGETALGHDSPILFIFLGHLGMALADADHHARAVAAFDRALKLGASDPSDVYFIAMLDARSLWDLGEKRRATELATKARDGFATLGPDKADQAREASDWLAAHSR